MSHLNTRIPTGNYVIQRRDPQPAFGNSLFERVFGPDNLQAAWKRVRANKGAAGVDGMTIDDYGAYYLYLRGMHPDHPGTGVFYDRPPKALIDAMASFLVMS